MWGKEDGREDKKRRGGEGGYDDKRKCKGETQKWGGSNRGR